MLSCQHRAGEWLSQHCVASVASPLLACSLVVFDERRKEKKAKQKPLGSKGRWAFSEKKAKGIFFEKKKGSLAESDKGSWYSPPLNNREEKKPKVVDKGLDSKDADYTSTSSSSDESDDARSDSEQRCIIFDTVSFSVLFPVVGGVQHSA